MARSSQPVVADAEDLRRFIEQHGITTFKAGAVDIDGVWRGKRIAAPYFADAVRDGVDSWRHVVAQAVELALPVPAFAAALTYFDGYRRDRLPANLLQAQRDYFGAHTYQRVDKPGTFHTDWLHAAKSTKRA